MSLEVEVAVLRGFLTASEENTWKQSIDSSAEACSLLVSLLEGDYTAVLHNPTVLELLRGDGSCQQGEHIEAYLERRLRLYLTEGTAGDQTNRQLVVMALAAACLHLFAQSNWTGPSLQILHSDLLPAALLSSQGELEAVHDSLLLDGESVYSLVSNPLLLLLARVILAKCCDHMSDLQLLPWWTLRYINLHQQILEACSSQLLSLAHSSIDKVQSHPVLSAQRSLGVHFHLECTYISLEYYDYQPAKEHIQRAQQLCGLNINMTGALGKRTRFQQNYLAQLLLEVKREPRTEEEEKEESSGEEDSPTATPAACLPKDHNLSDDTVLDQINLANPEEYQLPDLRAEEQALILGICTDFRKNNPVHKLTEEELLAFTCCLLSQPKFWGVHVAALCLRTKLEKGSFRRVERAMAQMQAIVDHFDSQKCSVSERLKLFYCSGAPTRWIVQKQLAAIMISLGCVSSALLIYEQLELWEDAVVCLERLGQHGKAEEIVRRELQKKETPTLYCLLGDILREQQYYDQAWALSGQRSARAMRSKALLHLHKKEFQEGVDCFEKSLHINAMQIGVWFSLGCAYFALEGYEGAAKAFRRCVILEPDNAEAWSNLATAHIRLKQKEKGFRTLQEALRCNFEQWQIWENFIVVCIDIGEFSEAMRAYHRLLDLRENYKDVQILQILVRAVVEDLSDVHGEAAQRLQSKLRELFGRVTSRHSSDAEIWQQYAKLYGDGRSDNPEDNDKALQFLSKAHRCLVQAGGWEKDPALFKEVLKKALDMGEVTISCSQKKSNPAEALQTASATRLSLRSLVTKAKQMHTDVATGQIHADLREEVASVERVIAELQELGAGLRQQSL